MKKQTRREESGFLLGELILIHLAEFANIPFLLSLTGFIQDNEEGIQLIGQETFITKPLDQSMLHYPMLGLSKTCAPSGEDSAHIFGTSIPRFYMYLSTFFKNPLVPFHQYPSLNDHGRVLLLISKGTHHWNYYVSILERRATHVDIRQVTVSSCHQGTGARTFKGSSKSKNK